ncbi:MULTISPECIES: C40 family peptidase [Paenibacillus]|uniref:Cell wall-associated NlpC family hydrolase n=1 Tax=Paenibacillus tundrae TaxID=528187 RepID=A0ABT9W952_9BACL|nr:MULTISPECIES: C40 family peptidase [Paenibacillus]MDQ0169780.1 cell wall-associated NlpC family hydrolase [Paenibacillus tundrae]
MKKLIISIFGAAVLFTSGATSTEASTINTVVNNMAGIPYKWGGTTMAGFDCSGFMRYLFDKYSIDLPRTSQQQAKAGTPVSKANLRTGDLVFFNTMGKGVSHAGVYIGDGQFAHASSSKGVSITKLSNPYFKDRYVTARRVTGQFMYNKMIGKI